MKKLLLSLVVLLFAAGAFASNYEYSLTPRLGFSTLTGGPADSATYTLKSTFGVSLGYRINTHWLVEADFAKHKIYNDTTKSSSFTFGKKENATRYWESTRIGLTLKKYLNNADNRFALHAGLGSGLISWKYKDPLGDSTFNVLGVHNETVDYAATELFVSGMLGMDINITPKWALDLQFRADYLTGAGAEFADIYKTEREKWQMELTIGLKFLVGHLINRSQWKSEQAWSTIPSVSEVPSRLDQLDADADGVIDKDDKCPDTEAGAIVDKNGCPIDSDRDGISDGLDHCENTDPAAYGHVDIHGCPVDSDFDGIPDYKDQCPNNPVGAHIDANGCPLDDDNDGVPNGLDDCPNTLVGVEVDRFGCIDLSFLAKPLVLNIDYKPGSFEIDPYSRDKLKKLSRVLNFLSEVRLEINAYTDNIGTTIANEKLSEKRAARVRDYLVSLGIAAERIQVYGRGEVNFVASNDTAEGRAMNRRIEILFYK